MKCLIAAVSANGSLLQCALSVHRVSNEDRSMCLDVASVTQLDIDLKGSQPPATYTMIALKQNSHWTERHECFPEDPGQAYKKKTTFKFNAI